MFRKFGKKIDSKILTPPKKIFENFSKIEIFRKFDQNRNFSKFSKKKSNILEKFDYGQLSK